MQAFKSYSLAIFYGFCSVFFYFLIDKLNIIKNHYKFIFDDKFVHICILFLFIFFIFIIIKYKLYNGFISNKINIVDYIITYFLSFSLFSIPSNIECGHETLISLSFFLLLLIIMIIRVAILFAKSNQKEEQISTNLYKIKELYENNENENKNSLILIEEKEVDNKNDDILDLSFVRDNLKRFVTECKTNKSFVLGLIGEWGIGKSSTIKLVESELSKENISFNYFNPWLYDNNNDLIEGFSDFIAIKLTANIKCDFELTRSLKKYKKMIIQMIDEKIGTNILSEFNNELEEEKKIINNCLSKSKNKIIIVVDNLDRINREQLHLLFNAINNILNFNGLIFILCYDEKIIKNILSKDSNYSINYMDKIINSKIYMPLMDTGTIMDIGEKCITNLLINSEIEIKYKYEFNAVVNFILAHITNLRELSRFINTLSLNLNVVKEHNLYINDFILLEYIKFSQNEFYNFIYNNIIIFYNKNMYDDYINYNKNNLYLIDDNVDVINFLFNDIAIFQKESTIYRESNDVTELRCSNPNLISVYFSQKQTNMLKITNEIINLVEKINNTKVNYGDTSLLDLCNNYKDDDVLNLFANYLNNINNKNNLLRMIIPFKYNKYLKSIIDYVIISKSEGIITQNIDLLKKHNRSLFIMYADDFIMNDFKYELIKNGLLEILKNYSEFCLKNISSIFRKEIYDKRVFYTCLKYIDEQNFNVCKYLNKNINEENIFRVLASFITNSFSNNSDYSYIIELDNVCKYLDTDNINKILSSIKRSEKNIDQIRVMTIYRTGNNKKYKDPINFNNL